MTETDCDSVGGFDSAYGVDSFDVGGTAEGADSSAVDDDSDAAAGTFILYPLSLRCIRRLTVFIFVEFKAIKNTCEPNRLRKRLPDASTSRTMLAMYAFFPLRS